MTGLDTAAAIMTVLLICSWSLPRDSFALSSDPIRWNRASTGEIRLAQRLSPIPQPSRPVPSPVRPIPQPGTPAGSPMQGRPPLLAQVTVTVKATPSSTGFGAVNVKSGTGLPVPNAHLFPVSLLNPRTFQATIGDTVRLEASTYDPDQQFVSWGGGCSAAGKNPVCLYKVPGPGMAPEVRVTFMKVPKTVVVKIKAVPGSTGFGAVKAKSTTGKPYPNNYLFPIDSLNSAVFQAAPGDTVSLEASTYDPDHMFGGWGDPCTQAGKNPICLYVIPAVAGSTAEVLVTFTKVPKTVLVRIKAVPGSTGFGAVKAKSTTGKPYPNNYLFPIDSLNSAVFQAAPGDTVSLEASTYDAGQAFSGWGAPCAQAGKNPICLYTVPALGSTPEVLLRFDGTQ